MYPNSNICDNNSMRYVGWKQSNDCIQKYFSEETVVTISRKVTELTLGVHPSGRPIVVPKDNICSLMSEIYTNYRPAAGDIYSRYTIPTNQPQNYVQSMIDQVIEVIVSNIRSSVGMDTNNKSLTRWTTVYGSFNAHGLRQTGPIKVRKRNLNGRGRISFMSY